MNDFNFKESLSDLNLKKSLSDLNIKESLSQSIKELRIKETLKEKKHYIKYILKENINKGKNFVRENPILAMAIAAILVMVSIPLIPILSVLSIISIVVISIILIFTVIVITYIGSRILGLIFKILMLFVPITEIAVNLFTYFSLFYLISRTYNKSKKILDGNKEIPKYKAIIDSFAETLVDYISLVCALFKNIKCFIAAVIRNSIEKKKLDNQQSATTSNIDTNEKSIENIDKKQEQQEYEQKNEETKKME